MAIDASLQVQRAISEANPNARHDCVECGKWKSIRYFPTRLNDGKVEIYSVCYRCLDISNTPVRMLPGSFESNSK